MITIDIPEVEVFNEQLGEFINIDARTLKLEHSLISLSKWESKHCKPFLHSKTTSAELVDYIRCMSLTEAPYEAFNYIPEKEIEKLNAYINSPMTATTFKDTPGTRTERSINTNETIYSQMIQLNIPFECQKWHLNRLLTLIRVCAIRQAPPKKMSQKEILARNKSLNDKRRARL